MNYNNLFKFPPTPEQVKIFDWVIKGRGHLFVEAVAGSGKTTTLKGVASLLKSQGIFCAFNRHIVEELKLQLKDTSMIVSTLHGIGLGAVKNMYPSTKVDGSKYKTIISALIESALESGHVANIMLNEADIISLENAESNPAYEIGKLVDMTRLQLIDLNSIKVMNDLADKYDIDIPAGMEKVYYIIASQAIMIGNSKADLVIDYTDMIYLPNILQQASPRKYPWVMVDEAQDLSPAQLGLAMQLCGNGGRMIFVGDRAQAIYAFAGADSNSVETIISRTNAEVLPLSVCWRCPVSHIEMAQEIVPMIKPAPNAIEGEITSIKEKDLNDCLQENDLVLCRTNNPLIKLCFELIKEGIAARVKGRDIGQGLKSIVRKTMIKGKQQADIEMFPELLSQWQNGMIDAILKRNGGDNEDPAILSIADKYECLIIIYSNSRAKNVWDLMASIDDLFSDERSSIWLSTIHKAKGLENERVFILHPNMLPHPMAKTPEAEKQEYNLKYVALTRAKRELFLVEE